MLPNFDDLHIIDIRAKLPRAIWSIGTRTRTTASTIHYNGPPVTNRTHDAELAQLVFDARFHMRPGALGAPGGGDGLQYHFAVLSDGATLQCRDINAKLWHCADATGNAESVSIHLPLGGAQDATEAQWQAVINLNTVLMDLFRFGRQRTFGHLEWPDADTNCPGPNLLRRLKVWRGEAIALGAGTYHIAPDVAQANVRQGPATTFPVAAVMYPGDTLIVDAITKGVAVGGDVNWLHRADGVGFVHSSLVAR